MEFKPARWMTVPRTEGVTWYTDPRYFPEGREKMQEIAVAGGAQAEPVGGFKRDRGDGVWVPCNPFSDGSVPVWIWWVSE